MLVWGAQSPQKGLPGLSHPTASPGYSRAAALRERHRMCLHPRASQALHLLCSPAVPTSFAFWLLSFAYLGEPFHGISTFFPFPFLSWLPNTHKEVSPPWDYGDPVWICTLDTLRLPLDRLPARDLD